MKDLLKVIAQFALPNSRINAASELAELIGVEEILCFVLDETIHTFLPANGFPQTNKNAKQWHEFLLIARNKPVYNGKISLGTDNKEVIAISADNGCIMVLIGDNPNELYIAGLQHCFTLIAALLKIEFAQDDIYSRIKNLEQSSIKSEQLTKHLDQAREKLQEALKTEEDFLSIASHELKTPVTSINAFIGILLQSFPPEKDKQANYFLTRTKLQVQRLITLITELLDVTKIKTGKLDLYFSEVQLNGLIDDLIQDYTSTYSSHKIIKNEIPSIMVRCDKNRIEQVLSNLLSNAIKYSPGSEKIFLTVSQTDKNVQIDIQDFGIGIAEKNKAKVFERFFREHSGDTGMLSSLGLGLFISADIIKRHNGRIWVDSNQGKGTTIHFTLPELSRI